MMSGFWRFLQSKRNQQVIGWLGGGLAVVAGGVWAVYTHFESKPEAPKATPAPIAVPAPATPALTPTPSPAPVAAPITASEGGIAIGGAVTNSTIDTRGSARR